MCFYRIYSTWSVSQWDLWEGHCGKAGWAAMGFIAVGDRPNFEALRQV